LGAAAHGDADARFMTSARVSGQKPAGLDEVVGLEIHQHREIESLARLDPPLHHGGDVGDHG